MTVFMDPKASLICIILSRKWTVFMDPKASLIFHYSKQKKHIENIFSTCWWYIVDISTTSPAGAPRGPAQPCLFNLKFSITFVCLRFLLIPIFFTNLIQNHRCFGLSVRLRPTLTCFVLQYGFEQILFRCVKYIETLYCFGVPSAYILIMIFTNCYQEVFE